MWAWLIPGAKELSQEIIRRIFTTNMMVGVFLGLILMLQLQEHGLIGNPQVADLRVEIAILQARVAELEATCVPFVLE